MEQSSAPVDQVYDDFMIRGQADKRARAQAQKEARATRSANLADLNKLLVKVGSKLSKTGIQNAEGKIERFESQTGRLQIYKVPVKGKILEDLRYKILDLLQMNYERDEELIDLLDPTRIGIEKQNANTDVLYLWNRSIMYLTG